MPLINIDLYEALLAAKVPKDKARAAATAVMPAEQAATKQDLAATKQDLKVEMKAQENRLTWRVVAICGGFATLIVAVLVLIN